MEHDKQLSTVFRHGSKTYFYSSLFFPQDIRRAVHTLYAFVRTADDFVDTIPQQTKAFHQFTEMYRSARAGKTVNNTIINQFVQLQSTHGIRDVWINAFLASMEQDLHKKAYKTLKETEVYIYGSGEVIGLMMAKIMGLPETAYPAAQKLGKAMQYLNFIRDIAEDTELGRTYLPIQEIRKHGLIDLSAKEARSKPDHFSACISQQLTYYRTWQKEAEAGFHFIPKRYLIPIKTASDMYIWTAAQIEIDPLVVFRKKVKPGKIRVIKQALSNALTL